MADPVNFTRPAAERIGRAVRIVESGNRDGGGPALDRPWFGESSPQPIRFCSWTSTWHVDTVSVIRFTPATNVTATATNVCIGVGPGDGWVAKKGTAGYQLIGAKLSLQPNYSTTSIQLLGHDTHGIARWYSITTCSTAAS